tara:strand:- start:129 stop:371 length:243 start_codon:yes stop_codon:yes gene_type:complete
LGVVLELALLQRQQVTVLLVVTDMVVVQEVLVQQVKVVRVVLVIGLERLAHLVVVVERVLLVVEHPVQLAEQEEQDLLQV